jgi:hypothetical protein
MIYLDYEKHVINTGGYDADDSWSRDSTRSEYSFIQLTKDDPHHYRCAYPIDISGEVWFIYAIWSTGDTFGHDEASEIELLYVSPSKENAEKVYNALRTSTDYTVNITVDGREETFHCGWHGYFESLDDLVLESTVL